MKSIMILGILAVYVFSLSAMSVAEAHPHVTIDLMESHSHDPNDENFQEEFFLHDFEHVIFSIFDFFNDILFG